MPSKIDLYIRNIDTSKINKEILQRYAKHSVLKNLSERRILKKLNILKFFLKEIKRDLNKTNKTDFERWFIELKDNQRYAPATKRDKIIIVKDFYKWYEGKGKRVPAKLEWMKAKNEKSKIDPADIISEQELEDFLNACLNVRDKAFFKFLRETGARIGEALSMRIKDIDFAVDETVVRFPKGKTGARTIMIIASVPLIKEWLNYHPDKNNPNAYLWTKLNKPKQMSAGVVKSNIKKILKRAKIKKRIYPHLFRHTCASELAKKGWSEREMELYLGWVHGSRMPQIYVHLTGRDLDQRVKERYGISNQETKKEAEIIRCPNCGTINSSKNKVCTHCHLTLDLKEAQKKLQQALIEEKKNKAMEIMIEKHPEMIEMLKKVQKMIENTDLK